MDSQSIKCGDCSKEFQSDTELFNHYKATHLQSDLETFPTGEVTRQKRGTTRGKAFLQRRRPYYPSYKIYRPHRSSTTRGFIPRRGLVPGSYWALKTTAWKKLKPNERFEKNFTILNKTWVRGETIAMDGEIEQPSADTSGDVSPVKIKESERELDIRNKLTLEDENLEEPSAAKIPPRRQVVEDDSEARVTVSIDDHGELDFDEFDEEHERPETGEDDSQNENKVEEGEVTNETKPKKVKDEDQEEGELSEEGEIKSDDEDTSSPDEDALDEIENPPHHPPHHHMPPPPHHRQFPPHEYPGERGPPPPGHGGPPPGHQYSHHGPPPPREMMGPPPHMMYDDRIPCKFFRFGNCLYGINCRFLHPGVNDLPPPGPPPRSSWEDEEDDEPDLPPPPTPSPPTESSWERGLRQAKKAREIARKRKEEETDFEDKRMNLRVPTPSPTSSPIGREKDLDEFGVGAPPPRGGVEGELNPLPPSARPPIPDMRQNYPPDRIDISERGIPYHEERIHGDPYDPYPTDYQDEYYDKEAFDGWGGPRGPHGGGPPPQGPPHYENFQVRTTWNRPELDYGPPPAAYRDPGPPPPHKDQYGRDPAGYRGEPHYEGGPPPRAGGPPPSRGGGPPGGPPPGHVRGPPGPPPTGGPPYKGPPSGPPGEGFSPEKGRGDYMRRDLDEHRKKKVASMREGSTGMRGRGDQWMDPWARSKDGGKSAGGRGRRRKRSSRSRGSRSSSSSSLSSGSRSRSSYSTSSSYSSRSSSSSRSRSRSAKPATTLGAAVKKNAKQAEGPPKSAVSMVSKPSARGLAGARGSGGPGARGTKPLAGSPYGPREQGANSRGPSEAGGTTGPTVGNAMGNAKEKSRNAGLVRMMPATAATRNGVPGREGKNLTAPPGAASDASRSKRPDKALPGRMRRSAGGRSSSSSSSRSRSRSRRRSSSGSSSSSRSSSSSSSSSASGSADSDNLYRDIRPSPGKERKQMARVPRPVQSAKADSKAKGSEEMKSPRGSSRSKIPDRLSRREPTENLDFKEKQYPSSQGRIEPERFRNDRRADTKSSNSDQRPNKSPPSGSSSSRSTKPTSSGFDKQASRDSSSSRNDRRPGGADDRESSSRSKTTSSSTSQPAVVKATADKDPLKLSGQKAGIKLTLVNKTDKLIKPTKRPPTGAEKDPAPPPKRSKEDTDSKSSKPAAEAKSSSAKPTSSKAKKSTSSRREELLNQLKAVESAIAKKRHKITP